ncbi:MAG: UDPGP type 1 family protein [Lentisphaerae bacterium]|nr:UDPGP type 1 family protein [Lentisphaerota bacterium]
MVLDNKLIDRLIAAGQSHLIKFFDTLDEAGQQRYAAELAGIDWDLLQELIKSHVMQKPVIDLPEDLTPAPYFPLQPRSEAEKSYYLQADAAGEELLRTGKVAALTVAGGQGSRLGFDGPKGTYPIAPVSGKTLFQYFAESLLSASRKYNTTLHWYIMTSVVNDGATREFFADNNYFGMSRDQIHFFTQGFMPAIGYDGKLLMSSTGSLALSPDGHGGTLLALRKSGMLDDMKMRGIEFLSYFQVDNPLVPVVDKRFIGLHKLENSEMSAITLAKTNAFEKVGNFCVADNRLYVIEYSDLPEALATQVDENGQLKFIAGSPAIHVISRSFVERLTASGRLQLDWHRADKKIQCIDSNGQSVNVTEPNGVKLESFIFDALKLADKTMIFEADRKEEFAPTKNATGVDSVESCRAMLIDRDARRLERCGVTVPRRADGSPDVTVEISPLAIWDDEDCAEYVKKHQIHALDAGSVNYLV